jgi:hypothetical protein
MIAKVAAASTACLPQIYKIAFKAGFTTLGVFRIDGLY